ERAAAVLQQGAGVDQVGRRQAEPAVLAHRQAERQAGEARQRGEEEPRRDRHAPQAQGHADDRRRGRGRVVGGRGHWGRIRLAGLGCSWYPGRGEWNQPADDNRIAPGSLGRVTNPILMNPGHEAEAALLSTEAGRALLAEVSAVRQPGPAELARWRRSA